MSWYNESADSDESLAKADKEAKSQRKPAKRFWMPVGVEKRLIFLDDNPPGFWEHNPMIGGTFRDNQFTCPRGENDSVTKCYLCMEEIHRYWVGFYTVLELSEVEYQGRTYKNFRRLLPAKTKSLKLLKLKRERIDERAAMEQKPQTGLAGKIFAVDRTSDKDANIGNNYDLVGSESLIRDEETGLLVIANQEYWWKRTRKDERSGKDMVDMRPPLPFDYKEVLAPKSNDELQVILARDGRATGNQGGGKDKPYNAGDQIPF
jgi:hypothetical protein